MSEATAQTTLRVVVVPGESRTELVGWLGRRLQFHITETAEDHDQGNQNLTQHLAEQLELSQTAVVVTHGQTSLYKTLTIKGLSSIELTERFRTLTKDT